MTYVSDFFAYQESRTLTVADHGFYALVMAAMRKADSTNAAKLRAAFPDVWADLQARYDAPGGVLDTDSEGVRVRVWGQAENPRRPLSSVSDGD